MYNCGSQLPFDGKSRWQRNTIFRKFSSTATILYREDVFTDRNAGTIRRLTPVTVGRTDATRHVLYSGQTQLLTPAGVLPLGSRSRRMSLVRKRCKKFPEGVKVALEQAIDEAREMRREAASRIVVPDVGSGVGSDRGRSGGGKIKFLKSRVRRADARGAACRSRACYTHVDGYSPAAEAASQRSR